MNDSDRPGDSHRHPGVPFLTLLIATGFFSGYIPWASGTFGTIVGLLLCLIPGVHTPVIFPLLIALVFPLGVYAAGKVAEAEGYRLSRTGAMAKAMFQPGERLHPDPSIVVIDEIIGVWVTILWLPSTVPVFLLAFFFFRLYDVLKPEPARTAERLPGGLGIMLDDVIAGVYGNITLRVILFLYPLFHGAASAS